MALLLNRLRWALARAEGFAWERYFAVDTRRPAITSLTAVPAESIPYEPLPWFLVRQTLGSLRPSQDDVFLDYGAGLGRVLLMAARHRLKRVVGVELLAPLAESARRNVAAARRRLRAPVEIVTGDAASWEVPDDVSIVFLFNPFVGTVMEAVQKKLRASLDRRRRRLKVIYAHAYDQADLFAPCDWLRRQRHFDVGALQGMNISLYEASGG